MKCVKTVTLWPHTTLVAESRVEIAIQTNIGAVALQCKSRVSLTESRAGNSEPAQQQNLYKAGC